MRCYQDYVYSRTNSTRAIGFRWGYALVFRNLPSSVLRKSYIFKTAAYKPRNRNNPVKPQEKQVNTPKFVEPDNARQALKC